MTQVDEGPESLRTPDVLTVGAPAAGEILAERYRLEEHISDDAYGRQVWRGLDVLLRRPIAVILRQPGGAHATEMLQAAVKASRVAHPHLASIYDAVDEGGKAYVVREWVEGISLRDAVAETPMDADRATSVAHAIAGAVSAFHAAGLTHGNIHPGTVLLGDEGQILLTDARSDDEATPDTDVRAVGGVLYAALTGHWPHREAGGASLPDAIRDPETEGPIPARKMRGGVPDHLSDLAGDLLNPDEAPPSADVLAAELGRLDSSTDEDLLDGVDQYGLGGGFLPVSNRMDSRRPVGRKLAVGVALLLVLAIVGLIIGFTVLKGDGKNSGAPSTPGASSGAVNRPDGGQTTQLPLKASQLSLVSPNGQHDNASALPNVVDGNGSSVWNTEHYSTSSDYFTNTKKGLGILIDLGSAQSVSEVKVDFTVPGATVQIETGDFPSAGGADGDANVINNYTKVGDPVQCGSTHDFTLPGDTPTRYVLVMITALPPAGDSQGGYRVGISEIKVLVNQ